MSWCQIRTAYLLGKNFDAVSMDWYENFDKLDPHLHRLGMPKHWSARGADLSGAAGFVIVFETNDNMKNCDLDHIEEALYRYLRELA